MVEVKFFWGGGGCVDDCLLILGPLLLIFFLGKRGRLEYHEILIWSKQFW